MFNDDKATEGQNFSSRKVHAMFNDESVQEGRRFSKREVRPSVKTYSTKMTFSDMDKLIVLTEGNHHD